MEKKIELVFILLVIFINQGYINAQHLTDYVDPLIGSGGHGHVFVGASVPFGAVKLGGA
jgi:putative alpha-1,2-mannosidase